MTHRKRLAASVGLVLLGAFVIIIGYQERYSKASVACRLYSYPWAENAPMLAPRHSDHIIGISNDVYTLNGTTCLSLSELEKKMGRVQFDRIGGKVFLSVNAQSTCDDLFKGGRVCAGLPIAEFRILVRDRSNQISSFPYYLPLMDGNRRHPWYEAVFSSECSKEQGAGEDSEEERAGNPGHYMVIEIAVTDNGYEINGRFQALDDARSFLAETKRRHKNLVVSYHPDPACTIQRLIDAIDVCYSLGIEAYVISMREARAGTAMDPGIDIVGIGMAGDLPKARKGAVAGGDDSERRWRLTVEPNQENRVNQHEREHEEGSVDGTGSGTTVFWNPASNTSDPDDNGSWRSTPWIKLAHEIGHVLDADCVTMVPVDPLFNPPYLPYTPPWEVTSVWTENHARDPTTSYGHKTHYWNKK